MAWRRNGGRAFGTGDLPNLMFPMTFLAGVYAWDDDWSCTGGPAGLVDRVPRHLDLQAWLVDLGRDATPDCEGRRMVDLTGTALRFPCIVHGGGAR